MALEKPRVFCAPGAYLGNFESSPDFATAGRYIPSAYVHTKGEKCGHMHVPTGRLHELN